MALIGNMIYKSLIKRRDMVRFLEIIAMSNYFWYRCVWFMCVCQFRQMLNSQEENFLCQ